MTTAPQAFDDCQTNRLEAFADAVRHYPGVIAATTDHRKEHADVIFTGHKSAIPMVVRDVAKAFCLTVPDAGNEQVQDSPDVVFQSEPTQGPRTKARFKLSDAMARNQR